MNRGLIDKVIRSLVIDPVNPSTIYAGTWPSRVTSRRMAASTGPPIQPGSTTSMSSRSRWTQPIPRFSIPGNRSARCFPPAPTAVWTWAASENVLAERLQCIAVDPVNPAHIYVGTRASIFRSTNSARSFERAGHGWSNAAWALVFDKRKTPPTLSTTAAKAVC